MMENNNLLNNPECAHNLLAIQDAMDVLSGKWTMLILGTLRFNGSMHFKNLQSRLDGVSAKVLTATLREMETNLLVSRTVGKIKPIKVMYTLTPYGSTLDKVIFEMLNWGLSHRIMITGKRKVTIPPAEYANQLLDDLPSLTL